MRAIAKRSGMVLGTIAAVCALAPPAVAQTEQIVVGFKSTAKAAERGVARHAAGTRAVRAMRTPGTQLLTVQPGTTVEEAIARLEDDPHVRYAEPNLLARGQATTPNDPRFAEAGLWGLRMIGAPGAWDLLTDSSGVLVAVVDSGIDLDHPEFASRVWTNSGEVPGNGVDDDRNGVVDDVHGWNPHVGTVDVSDDNGHGSHVAGTIGAAGNNGVGVTGVAWDTTLLPVKVLGADNTGFSASISDGIHYAASMGADVVNLSLSVSGRSQAIEDTIAAFPDTLFVVAAGNNGQNAETSSAFPCKAPGANVICVAATTSTDGLASFSNYGAASVDLGAPGQDVLSTSVEGTERLFDLFSSLSAWTVVGPWSIGSSGARLVNAPGSLTRSVDLTGGRLCVANWLSGVTPAGPPARLILEYSRDGAAWTTVKEISETGNRSYDAHLPPGGPLQVRFRVPSTGANQAVDLLFAYVACLEAPAYGVKSGTSMAAPHVSGAAALLLAGNPRLTPAQVRAALLDNGDPVPALAGKTVSGRRLNVDRALRATIAPLATTGDAEAITTGSARITGTVTPFGRDATYAFEYGTSPAYGASTPATPAGAGMAATSVSADLAGLAPGTTYHFRAVAYRDGVPFPGPDRAVTTASPPPPAATPAPAPAAPVATPRFGADVKLTCRSSRRRSRVTAVRCTVTGTGVAKATVKLRRKGRTLAKGTLKPGRRTTLSVARNARKGSSTAQLTVTSTRGATVRLTRTIVL
jgi:subtilisin family serine protease